MFCFICVLIIVRLVVGFCVGFVVMDMSFVMFTCTGLSVKNQHANGFRRGGPFGE